MPQTRKPVDTSEVTLVSKYPASWAFSYSHPEQFQVLSNPELAMAETWMWAPTDSGFSVLLKSLCHVEKRAQGKIGTSQVYDADHSSQPWEVSWKMRDGQMGRREEQGLSFTWRTLDMQPSYQRRDGIKS